MAFKAKLSCPVTLIEFTSAEGAGEHCELLNRSLDRDWIERWRRRKARARPMPGSSVTPGPLDGLFLVDLAVREDPERSGGSFREVFRAEEFESAGVPSFRPVQWNVSESTRGTLRGIHAEPWTKVVHVIHGEVFSAVADLRQGSATAGRVWTGVLDRTKAIVVGAGLGNSFQVVSDRAVVAYLVDGYWRPDDTYAAVRFDDPDLAIPWPITGEALALSDKDRNAPSLHALWAG